MTLVRVEKNHTKKGCNIHVSNQLQCFYHSGNTYSINDVVILIYSSEISKYLKAIDFCGNDCYVCMEQNLDHFSAVSMKFLRSTIL